MENYEFASIRQVARKYDFISETLERQLLKQGKLPGFYTGRKFMVNVNALKRMLAESHS